MRRVIKTHGMEMIGIMPIVVENIYLMGSCGTIMWDDHGKLKFELGNVSLLPVHRTVCRAVFSINS